MGVCSEVEDVSSTIVRNCHRSFPGDETPTCFYTVKDLQDDPPFREDNMTLFPSAESIPMSLWIGAGDTGPADDDPYPNPVSLGTFYTIYFHDKNDVDSMVSESSDYTPVLTALKGSLNLCTMTLQTKVTNGATTTTQTQQTTDLHWATSTNDTGTPIISVTATDGKYYSLTQHSGRGFKIYLADEIFYGNSQTLTGGYWGSTPAAQTLTGLLVDRPIQEGIDGLTKMLENMAIAMTNA